MTSIVRQYTRQERDRLLELVAQDPKGLELLRRARQHLHEEQDEAMDRAQMDALKGQARHLDAARKILLPYVGAPVETIPRDVLQKYTKEMDQSRALGAQYLRLARKEKQEQKKRKAREDMA